MKKWKCFAAVMTAAAMMIVGTGCSKPAPTAVPGTTEAAVETEKTAETEAAEPAAESENAADTAADTKADYYADLKDRISPAFEPEFDETTGKVVSFTDQAGNRIEVPEKIERVIISTRTPMPSVYCLYRGSAEGLIGISPGAMAAVENSYLPEVIPGIMDIRTDFMEGTKDINIEEMIKMQPDVVLCSAEEDAEIEMLTEVGILAVGFSTKKNNNNPLEIVNAWLQQLEMLFGEENNVAGIEEYGNVVMEMVKERASQIPEEDKPSVMIISGYAEGEYTVTGSNVMGEYWITTPGGVNAAAEVTGSKAVNMEQIYQWNPDIIMITNFSDLLPEDFYENAIEGDDWSPVAAVQNQKVYKYPLGMYRWNPPSSDAPLSLQWCAKMIQPEVFADIDLDQEVKDYYKKFYNKELTDEDLQNIYHPSREAARYVGR